MKVINEVLAVEINCRVLVKDLLNFYCVFYCEVEGLALLPGIFWLVAVKSWGAFYPWMRQKTWFLERHA